MRCQLPEAIDKIARFLKTGNRFAFFLGAGASQSACAPTGAMIIEELKADLFYREHCRNPRDIDELNRWFSAQTWLRLESTEYAAVLRRRFPDPWSRREYFEQRLARCRPSPGHRSLARLMSSPETRVQLTTTLTTNFDWLVETALVEEANLFPLVYDQAHHLPSDLQYVAGPTVVKLHGDYFYDDIANLDDELTKKMSGTMRTALQGSLRNRGLIVIGYRGADATIMHELIHLAQSHAGSISPALFWTYPACRSLEADVERLCCEARDHGREAWLVPIADPAFDTFLVALEHQLVTSARPPVPDDLTARHLIHLARRLSPRADGYYLQKLWPLVHTPAGRSSVSVDPIRLARTLPPATLAFVLGESGSGKSAMIASLALELMNEHCVPIVVELTRTSRGLNLPADDLAIAMASARQAILLVDALDQSARPEDVLGEVAARSAKLHVPALITSRPLGLFSARSEPMFEIRALEKSEIEPFVTHIWSDKLAARVAAELYSGPGTRSLVELCRNPMILKMAATVVAAAGQLTGKMQLYDDFTQNRLKFYQRHLALSEAELRQAAERVAYVVETQPRRQWGTLAASLAMGEGLPSPTHVQEQIATDLMRSGFTRVVGTDWEFLHRSYQSYFAAKAVLRGLERPGDPDRSRLSQFLLPSEITDFLGSYFDEKSQRIQLLRSLLQPHGSFDYSDVNLRYVPVFCLNHRGEALELMKDDLTNNKFEEEGADFFQEAAMQNSAMSGMLLGNSWFVGTWLHIIRRDHCDDSWNLCNYGGKFHDSFKHKLSWDESAALNLIEAAHQTMDDEEAVEALRQTLMHVGHLACERQLNEPDLFRKAIHALARGHGPTRPFTVPMNIIRALYRLGAEESIDVLLDAYGDGRGLEINWRVPRDVVRAILYLAPEVEQRKIRAAKFLRELLVRIRTIEPYQRRYIEIQTMLAFWRMGIEIGADLEETPGVRAVRAWTGMNPPLWWTRS